MKMKSIMTKTWDEAHTKEGMEEIMTIYKGLKKLRAAELIQEFGIGKDGQGNVVVRIDEDSYRKEKIARLTSYIASRLPENLGRRVKRAMDGALVYGHLGL